MTTFEVYRSTPVTVALADYQQRHGCPPPAALAVGAAVSELQAAGIDATSHRRRYAGRGVASC